MMKPACDYANLEGGNFLFPFPNSFFSLQFDPCPRAGEPMVSRRMYYSEDKDCALGRGTN